MTKYTQGILSFIIYLTFLQNISGQLKSYDIGFSSFHSHSSSTGNNSSFAFCYSNEDGNLVVCYQKDGCFTSDEVLKAGSVFMTAIATDKTDKIHILFTRTDMQYWPRATLYYITNSGGEWSEPVFIANSDQGINSLEMAMDSSGKIHAGYMKGRPTSSGKMIYLTNKSGSWVISSVGNELEAYACCSMALDKKGFVHFAFYGFTPYLGPGYITNAPSGIWQAPEEIHPDWRGGQMEGSTISIVTDTSASPHIAYSGDTKTEPSSTYMEHQQYAWKTQTGWKHLKVDNCNFQGAPNHIMLDSGHIPVIIYSNTVTDKMMLATDSLGTWVKKVLSTPAIHGKITCRTTTNGYRYFMWDDWSGELTLLTDAYLASAITDKENINFGDIYLGKDSTQTLLVVNADDNELKICKIMVTGPDKGEFYANFDKALLKSGDTCRINVTFKPITRGGKKASLLISSNSMDLALRNIILTGRGNMKYSQWAFDHKGKVSYVSPSILAIKDGNYLVGTQGYWLADSILNPSSSITKLSGTGNQIWKKKFNDHMNIRYFDGAIDQFTGDCIGYIFAGLLTDEYRKTCSPVFFLLDTAGNYQWGKKINDDNIIFHSILNTSDGGWIICGQNRTCNPTDNYFTLAVKTDSTGTIQWQKKYDFGKRKLTSDYAKMIIRPLLGEDGYILMTNKFYPDEYKMDLVIMRIDKNGNLLWSKIFGYNALDCNNIPVDIIETLGEDSSTNGYLILSHDYFFSQNRSLMFISRMNNRGELLWSKGYGPLVSPDAVRQTSDSTFVVLSHRLFSDSDNCYQLTGIDSSGHILWKNAFKGTGDYHIPSPLIVCQDKGYLFASTPDRFSRDNLLRIIKTDSLGQIPGCNLQVDSEITVAEFTNPPPSRVEDLEVQVNQSSYILVDFQTSLEDQYCQISEACSYSEPVDADKDGYPDEIESGPLGDNAGYDGNGDGSPDNQQVNVVSFHSQSDDYITIASPPGTALSDVRAETNPFPPTSPDSLAYIYDFFVFTVNGVQAGGATQVDLFLPAGLIADTYFKFGSVTCKDLNGETYTQYGFWYEFMYNDTTGAVIDSNHISLHFVDGKLGDDDLQADGIIMDMGAPAIVLRPKVTFSTDTLKFNTLRPAETENLNLIIKNTGEYKLVIEPIRIFGSDSLMFSVSQAGKHEIVPGDSLSLKVTFTPLKTGSMTAWIMVYSSDRDNREKKIVLSAACLDPSGFEENLFSEEESFTVFPNPADEYILVKRNIHQIMIPTVYELINIYGKTIYSGTIEQVSKIDTQNLPTGMYILRIRTERKMFNRKIIISRE